MSNKFAIEATSQHGSSLGTVVIESEDAEQAQARFEGEYTAYEVEVRTLPHDGSTHEFVFSQTEEAAREIATGRKGEYSDEAENVITYDHPIVVDSVTPLEDCDSLDVEHAESEANIERIVSNDE